VEETTGVPEADVAWTSSSALVAYTDPWAIAYPTT
jgi:hypothetical protein